MANPILIGLLAAAGARPAAAVQAFRDAGAVSPATARPLAELPRIDDAVLQALVVRGQVREGAPGTFYAFAQLPRASPAARWGARILFWVVIVLLPWLVLRGGAW